MSSQLASARMTPVDREYATCERTIAELRIYPSLLTVDEVSGILGVSPSEGKNAGDLVTGARDRVREVKRTYWCLSSEEHVDSKDLREHLNWLLDQLPSSEDSFIHLAKDDGLRMSICCIWWSCNGQGGPTLWPEQMVRISSLGLECTFDIQFYGEDE